MELYALCRAGALSFRTLLVQREPARDALIEIPLQHPAAVDELENMPRRDIETHPRFERRVEMKALFLWRHPSSRLCVAIVLALLNFVMFIEDPCSFAQTEAELSVVGNIVNLVFRSWPPEAGLCILKLGLLLVGLPVGFLFGRFALHHIFLRDTLKLPMFKELNGTILAEIFGMGLCSYLMVLIWKECLRCFSSADYASQYSPTSGLGMRDETFAYWVQIVCAGADVFTIVMLLDIMLQDTSQYPHWCLRLRILWRRSCIRLVSTWIAIPLFFFVMVCLINLSYSWDVYALQTERSRGLIAALIFTLDVITVCQDWEFPFFDNPFEINLVGTLTPDLDLGCTECQCSGKWLNYGPMVLVMLLDLNNLNNQWRYGFLDPPTYYGQYLDAEGWIWVVNNATIASRMRECYIHSPGDFHARSNRGSCSHAVPCAGVANMSEMPPCFDGDERLTGSVQQLDVLDFMLPVIPIFLAILVFLVFAYRVPQMPEEQKRRMAALSLLKAQQTAERIARSASSAESLEASASLRLEPEGEARLLRIAVVDAE